MSEKETTVAVENNTAAPIILIQTESFPSGMYIPCGLRRIPQLYIDEMLAHAVPSETKGGKPAPDRYPGRLEWIALTQTVVPFVKVTEQGVPVPTRGIRLTVYEDPQLGREEGPKAPVSLVSYSKTAAKELIRKESSKAVLEGWLEDRSLPKDTVTQIKDRLSAIKA